MVITVEILEATCAVSDAGDEDGTGVLDSELVVELAVCGPLEVDSLVVIEDELLDGAVDEALELLAGVLDGPDGALELPDPVLDAPDEALDGKLELEVKGHHVV